MYHYEIITKKGEHKNVWTVGPIRNLTQASNLMGERVAKVIAKPAF